MFGFGYNVFGQICSLKEKKCDNYEHGGLSVIDVPVQVDISLSEDVVKIQSSWTNTFLLKKNGTVTTSGWIPGTKALGNVNNFLPGEVVQDISCSCNKVALLSKAKKLFLWNDFMHENSFPTVVKLKESLSMIRCGDLLTIVLTDDGHLGQLVTDSSTTQDEEVLVSFAEITFSHCVQTVSCGKEHVLILTDKGAVFSFGGGSRGQIGNGRLDQQDEPKPIEALSGITIRVTSCGGWHSAVITSCGDLYMWGWNKDGQVGVSYNNTDIPQEVPVQIQAVPVPVVFSNDSVTDVSCGSRHTAAITCNGELWTWGFGFYGQLGHGSRKSCRKPTMVKFSPTLSTLTKMTKKSIHCNHWNTFVSVKKDATNH
ncbi:X-linked retinitis pigmentosa GTPase regulator-like [Actinia tenebrosa]|uniref:X-linked retinitis pigmentosa GTPase regulator-like n=1 Tax=Actinia tenebrosa TaxID=6105 RepID=A0A6P8IMZ4_ACTTE|nr:X-linked retinitis pigmentosa GTPase regulator-like [Actinia tenebrosa]